MEGGSETLTASVTPSNAVNKNVTWSSSDASIASIDANGVITAKKPGTATITVTTADGNKTATLSLTVTIDYVTRQRAILNKLFDSLGGSSWTKKDGWKKDDVELKDWYGITMSGDRIVSISLSNNNLKGKIPADLGATLAVTRSWVEADTRAEDEEATTRAEENVTILGDLEVLDLSHNQIEGTIPQEIGNLNVLRTFDVSYNELTGNLPESMVKMESLKTLAINNNNFSGNIPTAITSSEMWKQVNENESVDLKQNDGSELVVQNVNEPTPTPEPEPTPTPDPEPENDIAVTGISLNKESLELIVGETETLIATILPDNATDKSVSWSRNNSTVATIDANGKVTAMAVGSVIITVTSNDGNLKATCTVIVKPATGDSASSSTTIEDFGTDKNDW
mgnify:CR=1 FL=1